MPRDGRDKKVDVRLLYNIYPEDKGDYLLFGKDVIRALNTRIAYLNATMKYYDARLTELTAGGRETTYWASRTIKKMQALKVKHQSMIEYFQDLRDTLYAQVDVINRDETEDYQKVFKALFLDGLSIKEASQLCQIPQVTVCSIVKRIRRQMFDEFY